MFKWLNYWQKTYQEKIEEALNVSVFALLAINCAILSFHMRTFDNTLLLAAMFFSIAYPFTRMFLMSLTIYKVGWQKYSQRTHEERVAEGLNCCVLALVWICCSIVSLHFI